MAVGKVWDASAGEWVVEPDWFYWDSSTGSFERGIGKVWNASAGEWVTFTQLVVDTFEDGDMDEYLSDGAGNFNVTTDAALSGTFGLETSSTFITIWSRQEFSPRLENYPQAGDVFEFYWHPLSDGLDAGSEQYWFIFGKTTDQPDDNQYTVEFLNEGGFRIRQLGPANPTITVAADNNVPSYTPQWYRVEVTWDDGSLGGSNGDMTAILEDESGNQITSISGNDTTWMGGGIGWRQSGGGAAGHAYWDDCYILP